MNKQELTELMQATAQDAVVYAAEEHQVLLDFSLDSLVKVDEILSELYLRQQEQRHADDLLFTLCNVFGAYTGEVFIHHVGGEWYHDESTPDAPYICVRYNGKEFPFLFGVSPDPQNSKCQLTQLRGASHDKCDAIAAFCQAVTASPSKMHSSKSFCLAALQGKMPPIFLDLHFLAIWGLP